MNGFCAWEFSASRDTQGGFLPAWPIITRRKLRKLYVIHRVSRGLTLGKGSKKNFIVITFTIFEV